MQLPASIHLTSQVGMLPLLGFDIFGDSELLYLVNGSSTTFKQCYK